MYAYGFRIYFTPFTRVLFAFPSRYWFTIGQSVVFSLGGWSPHLQTGFHVSRLTRLHHQYPFAYGAITRCGRPFHSRSTKVKMTLGLVPVRSSLLGESRLISFPPGTEIFQFSGFASVPYVFRHGYPSRGGFPHSDIAGSKLVASSPTLFAGCHVLHRL